MAKTLLQKSAIAAAAVDLGLGFPACGGSANAPTPDSPATIGPNDSQAEIKYLINVSSPRV